MMRHDWHDTGDGVRIDCWNCGYFTVIDAGDYPTICKGE